jgi:hypothetical protein
MVGAVEWVEVASLKRSVKSTTFPASAIGYNYDILISHIIILLLLFIILAPGHGL